MWCTFVNTWEMQIANTYKRKVTAVGRCTGKQALLGTLRQRQERQPIGHRQDKQYHLRKQCRLFALLLLTHWLLISTNWTCLLVHVCFTGKVRKFASYRLHLLLNRACSPLCSDCVPISDQWLALWRRTRTRHSSNLCTETLVGCLLAAWLLNQLTVQLSLIELRCANKLAHWKTPWDNAQLQGALWQLL